MPTYDDGTPQVATQPNGEKIQNCIRCDFCGRVWYWKNIQVVGRQTICDECEEE